MVVLGALWQPLLAQSTLWYEDRFTDNKGRWTSMKTNGLAAQYTDSGLVLTTKSNMQVERVGAKPCYIDPNKDLTVEFSFKWLAGKPDNGLSITYAFKNDFQHYRMFWNKGRLLPMTMEGSEPVLAKNAAPGDISAAINVPYVFRLEKRGDQVRYYMNGKPAGGHMFTGKWLGGFTIELFGQQPQTLLFRQLKLWQDNTLNLVDGAATPLKRVNLGEQINQATTEIAPIVTADGQTLYFTVSDDTKPELDQEVYFSRLNASGTWQARQPIGSPINNNAGNNVVSASPDNNSLMLLNQYNPDGSYKTIGFSISNRESWGWAVPENIVVDDFYVKSRFVNACLAPDNKTLILGVKRDDTAGEEDLYVCFKKPTGDWTKPKNMGRTLNTIFTESTPFVAADNKSLYFCSEGHPGYGGLDIFVSRRLDDTWLNWSTPQNLGSFINSAGMDAYFTLPASGKKAYMVSIDNPERNEDIFEIELPVGARPMPSVLVTGKVVNQKNQKPLSARITYRDLESDTELGTAISNPVDGSYTLVLPAGRTYRFLAQRDSFYAQNENVDTRNLNGYEEIRRDLRMIPIEKGMTFRLNNLFFDFSKSELQSASYPELNQLVQILTEKTNLTILISGHTDHIGDDASNLKLSQARADAVKAYLLEKGIEAKRLQTKGFGESKPVAPNTTDEGRRLNRRVEVTILNS
jgi:outer membrane protein OmpA-like peptidoglycan-associated protein